MADRQTTSMDRTQTASADGTQMTGVDRQTTSADEGRTVSARGRRAAEERQPNPVERRSRAFRKFIQAGWGILTNAFVTGFYPGMPPVYTGPLKQFCVPGLNCYSCPGALGSCPIGAMQAIFDARQRGIAAYVIGYLAVIGLVVGRFICGWLCLFGLIQELLYKIPTPKLKVPKVIDQPLRYLKYLVLIMMVFALPFFYRGALGTGDPFFCKYICPAGTLEAAIPIALIHEQIRGALGALFEWKIFVLILCVVASVFIYRPFCKYLCPLGAFYAIFQKASLVRMRLDEHACVDCGTCADTCKMGVDPRKASNSNECIRCRECVHACPMHALSMKLGAREASEHASMEARSRAEYGSMEARQRAEAGQD